MDPPFPPNKMYVSITHTAAKRGHHHRKHLVGSGKHGAPEATAQHDHKGVGGEGEDIPLQLTFK